jgi:hypothetical protein
MTLAEVDGFELAGCQLVILGWSRTRPLFHRTAAPAI